jgi:hypothetical protein
MRNDFLKLDGDRINDNKTSMNESNNNDRKEYEKVADVVSPKKAGNSLFVNFLFSNFLTPTTTPTNTPTRD